MVNKITPSASKHTPPPLYKPLHVEVKDISCFIRKELVVVKGTDARDLCAFIRQNMKSLIDRREETEPMNMDRNMCYSEHTLNRNLSA